MHNFSCISEAPARAPGCKSIDSHGRTTDDIASSRGNLAYLRV